MSTWISKAALAATIIGLAACAGGIDVGRRAPEAVTVAGGEVIIAGPPGYCIDRSATRDMDGGAFVLLGSCASIARNAALPHPAAPAVLTVTVSEGLSDPDGIWRMLGELQDFFRSPEGRAALSPTGDASTVDVLDTRLRQDALYVHARGPGDAASAGDDETWRAIFGVNGRLLTVSVIPVGAPLSDDAGIATLDALTTRIRTENQEAG